MRKKIFLILIVGVVTCILLITFVGNLHIGKDKDIMKEILNGKATVSNEVRALASYTQEEIVQDSVLQDLFNKVNEINLTSTAHNNINVAYGDLYTSTVITSNGDILIYRSLPSVLLMVSDVGTAGSTDINCKFEIIEHISVNGDIATGLKNIISYRSIFSELACGDNTAFTSSMKLTGETALNNFNVTDRTFESIYNKDLEKEELYSDNHYLNFMSSISTVDSSKMENQVTTAKSQFTFDIYFYGGSSNSEYGEAKISCDTNYLVNMK